MDGPSIIVNSNCQDGTGNTMNDGKIIIFGDAGDIAGHSMRGGKIFVQGNVGYRVGIHIKSYKDLYPVIIAGETAGDRLGEYIAGGLIIVLGLNRTLNQPIVGNSIGTGMHGGKIYIRGKIENYQLGKEVKIFETDKDDEMELRKYLEEYCQDLKFNLDEILKQRFLKLIPWTHRPYGKLYT